MSDPVPALLPVVCKDIAFARNLIAQMKEGHGRHVSSRNFRQRLNEPERLQDFRREDLLPDRVIGILDGIRVLADPQKCEIGELTQNLRMHIHSQFCKVLLPQEWRPFTGFEERQTEPIATASFERVRYVFPDGRAEIFWKRIS